MDQLAPDLLITDILIKEDQSLKTNIARYHIGQQDQLPEGCYQGQISKDMFLPFYTGFTSGSTGLPKGFTRHQQSWLDSFAADQDIFHFDSKDRIEIPGSLAHSLFLYAAVRGLYQGATIRLHRTFRPDRVLRRMSEDRASVIFATPVQIRALLDAKQITKRLQDDAEVSPPSFASLSSLPSLPSLRLILSSGAKFPAKWYLETRELFPNSRFFEFYGSSELSYISTTEVTEHPIPTSVGKPFKALDVKILDQAGAPLPTGSIGQIYVNSPFLFMGYASGKNQTNRQGCRFQGDYLSVGDLGFLDGDGNLHLAGRVDRMLLVMGRNIYPEEIENTLLCHPALSHAAVIGESDLRKGITVSAILKQDEVSGLLTLKEVIIFCRQHLPAYAIPNRFYAIEDWPYTVSDKTDLKFLEQALKKGQLKRL